jgi:hypothetical protein
MDSPAGSPLLLEPGLPEDRSRDPRALCLAGGGNGPGSPYGLAQ